MVIEALWAGGESLDSVLERRGYVDVAALGVGIEVRLMYAREDNFTGRVLYPEGVLERAWLHRDAAEALERAGRLLEELAPGVHLLVKDAGRPMSVQRAMYRAVAGSSKARYVANPARGGGLHNYGLAVDVTLADGNGNELPMGTEVDYLGAEANIDREEALVGRGVISETERQNRLLLRRVMCEAGFSTIRTEWWHFNLCSREVARRKYELIDF